MARFLLESNRDRHSKRLAIHPGELLLEEDLQPLKVGQIDAARKLGVSLN
jgi:plasmid maintenance system antidote protein VapI